MSDREDLRQVTQRVLDFTDDVGEWQSCGDVGGAPVAWVLSADEHREWKELYRLMTDALGSAAPPVTGLTEEEIEELAIAAEYLAQHPVWYGPRDVLTSAALKLRSLTVNHGARNETPDAR